MDSQWVYRFGPWGAENQDSEIVGGKGAQLARMARAGLPVPAGFTISTVACADFFAADGQLSPAVIAQIDRAVVLLGEDCGAIFGDPLRPLLVSVRSGARSSMPGMMDTLLNLGLNTQTIEGFARCSGDADFAYACYRRFLEMYGQIVLSIPALRLARLLKTHGGASDERPPDGDCARPLEARPLEASSTRRMCTTLRQVLQAAAPESFAEEDLRAQLLASIAAVFRSWHNPRARLYRQLHEIPESWGTAVTVQAMVFGNRGADSATGVVFTRNPSTGVPELFGEYLVNAQGEDIVAGHRTPAPLSIAKDGAAELSFQERFPEVYKRLRDLCAQLEQQAGDMQDIEFTVEQGRLYLLQTRCAKRSAQAAIRVALDLEAQGVLTRHEALLRVEPSVLPQLLHPTLKTPHQGKLLAQGLAAAPGAVVGGLVFSSAQAEAWAREGRAVILCRPETSPDDIRGLVAARGVVTARGGMTSHAAVVARGMGRCCVVGAGALRFGAQGTRLEIAGQEVPEGTEVTLDGNHGCVYAGALETCTPRPSVEFERFMRWADAARKLCVRANADTVADCRLALEMGAQGIGLCRSEHMFLEPERLRAMRRMIFAPDTPTRQRILADILPQQRDDFCAIFRVMGALPVTIRLLDPPLHEFLPRASAEMLAIAQDLGLELAVVRAKRAELREENPMLGHRGCRLGVSYPEIYQMQIRAIFEAALIVAAENLDQPPPQVEVMIPLVAWQEELVQLKALIIKQASEVMRAQGRQIAYRLGTMIEIPRACLIADTLAAEAEFFSFGTNDLTQMTYGLSRDDSSSFLPSYLRKGIAVSDPFMRLDQDGVGQLIARAAVAGRAVRPGLKLGLCGEHGGDPETVAFCAELDFDYVSCSPYRLPVARLAAAQAAITARSPPRSPRGDRGKLLAGGGDARGGRAEHFVAGGDREAEIG